MIDPDLDQWITRHGEELPLLAMSNSHLQNAIAALTQWRAQERRPEKAIELRDWIKVFKAELKKRHRAAAREMRRRGMQ